MDMVHIRNVLGTKQNFWCAVPERHNLQYKQQFRTSFNQCVSRIAQTHFVGVGAIWHTEWTCKSKIRKLKCALA